ncbi:MAG TPA: hypothetical protein VNU69_01570 [Rhizomicrobium sp.]|nr:hypothetical protein [Rhizomicrobium sp.]
MNESGEDLPLRRFQRIGMEALAGIAGALLLAGAIWTQQSWWDRHFLPVFFFSHDKYVLGERLTRLVCGITGIALILFVRPMLGRLARRMTAPELAAATARIALAIGLALVASEVLLDRHFTFAAAEKQDREEPLRQPNPKLGWIFSPARAERTIVGGRTIAYAIDPLGYRVRDNKSAVNTSLPTILFTGESIIAGYGLNWNETIPTQVGAALGMQSANMAVFGYANDQAYLRLVAELPRFRQPVAVVSLFIPSLFVRNLGDDRPHLDSALGWKPAIHRLWLSALLRFFVPYHSDTEIERGIQTTRTVLAATTAMAHKRGAISLVVDPQYGPESPAEEMLRRRILDEPGIPYVRVMLDPSWHLKGDLHPDPRAAQAIAAAITARLKAALAQRADARGIQSFMAR